MNKFTEMRIQSDARSCEMAMYLADEFRRNNRDAQCIADLEARAAKASADAFAAAQGFPT